MEFWLGDPITCRPNCIHPCRPLPDWYLGARSCIKFYACNKIDLSEYTGPLKGPVRDHRFFTVWQIKEDQSTRREDNNKTLSMVRSVPNLKNKALDGKRHWRNYYYLAYRKALQYPPPSYFYRQGISLRSQANLLNKHIHTSYMLECFLF